MIWYFFSIICLYAERNSWKTDENLKRRLLTVKFGHFHLKFSAWSLFVVNHCCW